MYPVEAQKLFTAHWPPKKSPKLDKQFGKLFPAHRKQRGDRVNLSSSLPPLKIYPEVTHGSKEPHMHEFIKASVSYLEEEEGLSEPVVHDGGLSRVVVELPPDELGHEGLDEQAAAQHRQVVSTEQQRHQQHQAAVNLPQSPALELGVGRDDLRSQEVLAAREEDAQNKDVDKTSLHGSPERQRERGGEGADHRKCNVN